MTIYRYGWLAWFWRGLALVGIAGAALLVVLSVRTGELWLLGVAAPLALPALFFPWVLAVRIDRPTDDQIVVTNLFFVPRRIDRSRLGRPRVRLTAYTELVEVSAPRAWIPVQGSLPVYVDLLADIPDLTAFRSVFDLRG